MQKIATRINRKNDKWLLIDDKFDIVFYSLSELIHECQIIFCNKSNTLINYFINPIDGCLYILDKKNDSRKQIINCN